MKHEGWAHYQCMVACSIDGNRRNQLLAFAIVPSESKENYEFFIDSILATRLRSFFLDKKLICLSDRGKALLAALRASLPNAHNRYCYRHFLGNFPSELRKGSKARTLFETIVFTSEMTEFVNSLDCLRAMCPNVVKAIEEMGVERIAECCIPAEARTYSQRTSNLAEQRMAWLRDDVRKHAPVTGVVKLLEKLNRSYDKQRRSLEKAKKKKMIVSTYIFDTYTCT
jgi:transposase-like protein